MSGRPAKVIQPYVNFYFIMAHWETKKSKPRENLIFPLNFSLAQPVGSDCSGVAKNARWSPAKAVSPNFLIPYANSIALLLARKRVPLWALMPSPSLQSRATSRVPPHPAE